jgi:ubiquinol-cytochrome c reductase iron-sulfur subunit
MTELSANSAIAPAPLDKDKRNWMVATGVVGGLGVAAVAVPFVSTFTPSERAKAAGASVEVDISGIKAGEKITVEWRGKPVWILKRTPEQIAALPKHDAQLADPQSNPKRWWLSAFAHIWAARRLIN